MDKPGCEVKVSGESDTAKYGLWGRKGGGGGGGGGVSWLACSTITTRWSGECITISFGKGVN